MPNPPFASVGPIAVASEALATLISNLPFFITWTGAANAAAALVSVYVGEVGYQISSFVISGGVCTVVLGTIHAPLNAGQVVTLAGASIGFQAASNLSGPQTIVDVTTTGFTFAIGLPDAALSNPDFAFVLPSGRPFAVVVEPDQLGQSVRGTSVGTGGASVLAGTLEIMLEAQVSAAYYNDPSSATQEMRNSVGTFLQQLIQTQGTGDFIVLNGAELVSAEFTDQTDQDQGQRRFERWRALIRCTWGLDG